ncbi:hypothetical protein Ngar_c03620 [Candidatus Nitrososphaera gargensis Ga9.2]|uniref:Uncharacterized protein n=1 Tax=Nitrososphaera gargensis (strain Ga9.2) TaxID=1237085 RepID=K0ICJ0_NITGG|nr:hypothetical protein [Candidatus Nitrososphaera gargensis]AFU57310.1 hypothetical protein Ngar_c03620 [Candidatus Nitrososphaera gargensis Ga9.2]
MNNNLVVGLAIGLLAAAVLIMLHHWNKHGYIIDKNDVNSHEFFAGLASALGAGLLIGGGT